MRKKGLVERLVMSEPALEDFSPAKFPKNRVELFKYMLKNKFFKIYKNHWFISLFFLPLIVWGVLTMGYTDWMFSLDPKEGIQHLFEYWFTVHVTALPLWIVAFLGLAGGLNVLRKLVWSDPVMLKSDFWQGIKASGKQISLIGLLFGVAYSMIRYAMDWLGFYYRVFEATSTAVFGIFVCVILLLVLIGYTAYLVCMSSLYNVTLKQLLVGAFKLYFADFFMASGTVLLCLIPMLIFVFSDFAILILIGYFVLLAGLIGFIIIPPFLVCQHTFDRIINKKDYPSYYGRGLSYGVYAQAVTEENEKDEVQVNLEEELEDDFERVNDDEN